MLVFLQELFTVKKAEEEVLVVQDSYEEPSSPECRWEANAKVSEGDLAHTFITQKWDERNSIYKYFSH